MGNPSPGPSKVKKQSPKTGPHRRTPSVTSLSLDPLNKEALSPDKANGPGKTAHTPAGGSGEKSVSPASKDAGKFKRRSRSSLGGAEDLVRGIDFGANTSPAEESKKHSYLLARGGGSRNVTRPGKASQSSNSPVRRTATTPPGTEKIIGRVSSTSILSPRKFVSPQRTISAVECLTMNGITNSNGDMELQSVRSELSAESLVADEKSLPVTKDGTLVKGRSLVKGQQDFRPTRPGLKEQAVQRGCSNEELSKPELESVEVCVYSESEFEKELTADEVVNVLPKVQEHRQSGDASEVNSVPMASKLPTQEGKDDLRDPDSRAEITGSTEDLSTSSLIGSLPLSAKSLSHMTPEQKTGQLLRVVQLARDQYVSGPSTDANSPSGKAHSVFEISNVSSAKEVPRENTDKFRQDVCGEVEGPRSEASQAVENFGSAVEATSCPMVSRNLELQSSGNPAVFPVNLPSAENEQGLQQVEDTSAVHHPESLSNNVFFSSSSSPAQSRPDSIFKVAEDSHEMQLEKQFTSPLTRQDLPNLFDDKESRNRSLIPVDSQHWLFSVDDPSVHDEFWELEGEGRSSASGKSLIEDRSHLINGSSNPDAGEYAVAIAQKKASAPDELRSMTSPEFLRLSQDVSGLPHTSEEEQGDDVPKPTTSTLGSALGANEESFAAGTFMPKFSCKDSQHDALAASALDIQDKSLSTSDNLPNTAAVKEYFFADAGQNDKEESVRDIQDKSFRNQEEDSNALPPVQTPTSIFSDVGRLKLDPPDVPSPPDATRPWSDTETVIIEDASEKRPTSHQNELDGVEALENVLLPDAVQNVPATGPHHSAAQNSELVLTTQKVLPTAPFQFTGKRSVQKLSVPTAGQKLHLSEPSETGLARHQSTDTVTPWGTQNETLVVQDPTRTTLSLFPTTEFFEEDANQRSRVSNVVQNPTPHSEREVVHGNPESLVSEPTHLDEGDDIEVEARRNPVQQVGDVPITAGKVTEELSEVEFLSSLGDNKNSPHDVGYYNKAVGLHERAQSLEQADATCLPIPETHTSVPDKGITNTLERGALVEENFRTIPRNDRIANDSQHSGNLNETRNTFPQNNIVNSYNPFEMGVGALLLTDLMSQDIPNSNPRNSSAVDHTPGKDPPLERGFDGEDSSGLSGIHPGEIETGSDKSVLTTAELQCRATPEARNTGEETTYVEKGLQPVELAGGDDESIPEPVPRFEDCEQANSFPSDNEDFKETTQEFENVQAITCNLPDGNGPSDKRPETTAGGIARHSGTEPLTNGLVDREGVSRFPSENNAVTNKLSKEADKKEPEIVSRSAAEGEQALEEVPGREVEQKVPESSPQEHEPVASEEMFYDASSSTPPKGTERPEDLLEIDLDKHEHILETEGDDDHMLANENRVNEFDSSPFPKETLLKEEGVPREADPVRGGIGGSPVATSQKEEQIAGADEIVSDGLVSSPGVQFQSVSGHYARKDEPSSDPGQESMQVRTSKVDSVEKEAALQSEDSKQPDSPRSDIVEHRTTDSVSKVDSVEKEAVLQSEDSKQTDSPRSDIVEHRTTDSVSAPSGSPHLSMPSDISNSDACVAQIDELNEEPAGLREPDPRGFGSEAMTIQTGVQSDESLPYSARSFPMEHMDAKQVSPNETVLEISPPCSTETHRASTLFPVLGQPPFSSSQQDRLWEEQAEAYSSGGRGTPSRNEPTTQVVFQSPSPGEANSDDQIQPASGPMKMGQDAVASSSTGDSGGPDDGKNGKGKPRTPLRSLLAEDAPKGPNGNSAAPDVASPNNNSFIKRLLRVMSTPSRSIDKENNVTKQKKASMWSSCLGTPQVQ